MFRQLLLTEKFILAKLRKLLNDASQETVYYTSRIYRKPQILNDFEQIRPFLVKSLLLINQDTSNTSVCVDDIYTRYYELKHIYYIIKGYNLGNHRRRKMLGYATTDIRIPILFSKILYLTIKYNTLLVKKLDIIKRIWLDSFTQGRLFAVLTDTIREY